LLGINVSCHEFIHYQFAKTYLRDFITYTLEYLKEFSLSDQRNFKREKFDKVIKNLKDIMYKVYLEPDINNILDNFGLDFGINCIKSHILDKNLLGLKILTETLNEASKGFISVTGMVLSDKHVPTSLLFNKCLQENLFDLIFSAHNQIIQNSADLIKIFLTNRILTKIDLEKIWNKAQNIDLESKKYTYKVFQNNCPYLSTELSDFLIEKITSISHDNLTGVDIDLLIKVYKSAPIDKMKEYVELVTNTVFNTLMSNIESGELLELLLSEFENLLKSWELREFRMQYLELMVVMVVGRKNIFKSLKVIRRTTTLVFIMVDDTTKNKMMNLMLETYSLMDILFLILKEYFEKAKETINQKNLTNTDIETYNFTEEYNLNHNEAMSELFSFLNFITSNNKSSFTKKQIMNLFDLFVLSPICSKDINLFFKWLKECEEKKVIPDDSLKEMLNLMAESDEIDLNNMSLDLFNCLWNIFLSINKAYHKMSFFDGLRETFTYLMSNSSNNYNNNEKINETKSDPFQLEGIELIWKLVISAPRGEISTTAINSFLKLFINSNDNTNSKEQIWSKLISKCIETIKQIKQTQQNESINKTRKIHNCLNLLKCLIEESEKKGTAGCISHSSILRTSIKVINVSNALYHSKSMPKDVLTNFTLKVFANTTLWDLKKIFAKKCKVIPEAIKITSTTLKDITENDHGKTLTELKFKDEESITINRNSVLDNIPKQALVRDRGELTDKFKKALNEIFSRYSTNGEMHPEECARFATVATDSNETLSVEDYRVKGVYQKYDQDRDKILKIEDFYMFFRDKILIDKRVNLVWGNLQSLNYRNDLKQIDEPLDEYNNNKLIMPRYVLSKNQDYFNVISSLQDDEDSIAKEASQLLLIISTNPLIFKHILLLEKLNSCDKDYNFMDLEGNKVEQKYDEVWAEYLDKNNFYKLLYSLQIIDSFFEDLEFSDQHVDCDPTEMLILDDKDKELLQNNQKLYWIESFLSKGGITYLINNIFFKDINNVKFSGLVKKCLNLTIKIIRNTSTCLFKSRISKNKDFLDLIRKKSFTKELSEELLGLERKISLDTNNANNNDLILDRKISEDKNNLEENLIQILIVKCGKQLINSINFKSILNKLMEIMYYIITQNDIDYEERSLINNSINLWTLIIISNENPEEILNYLYKIELTVKLNKENNKELNGEINGNNVESKESNDNKESNDINVNKGSKGNKVYLEDFLFQGLLINPNLSNRVTFQKTIQNLCISFYKLGEIGLITKMLLLLKAKLVDLNDTEKLNCKQLFGLFESLLSTGFKNNKITELLKYKELTEVLVNKIISSSNSNSGKSDEKHKLSNSSNSNVEYEDILVGYLKIINVVVINDKSIINFIAIEKDLIKILIDKFLLKNNNNNNKNQNIKENIDQSITSLVTLTKDKPTTTNEKEKRAYITIYELLQNLISNDESINKLFESNLAKLKEITSKLNKRSYNPDIEKRSSFKYVGLKNLGATCYMNAMLQQFFMIPTFRYCLIQVLDNVDPIITDQTKNIDDNMFHQLQKMFSFLELSNRVEYFPSDFCYTYKDFDVIYNIIIL